MQDRISYWARLRPNLTERQRFTAVAMIAFGALATLTCLVVIFALSDLGRPSILPWIAWLLFGVGPIVTAFEEYGADEVEAPEKTRVHSGPESRPTAGHLRLIHSPNFTTEEKHEHHARATG